MAMPPHVSCFSYGRILKLICLLLTLQHTRSCTNSCRMKVKFAASPWPSDWDQLSVCVHWLSAKASSPWHWECTQGSSHRVCVCVNEVCRVLGQGGWLWANWEDPQGTHPQMLLGRLLEGDCEAVNRIYSLLMPSKNPICQSLSFLSPPSLAGHDSGHWSQ